jgi:hypothetical protein
MIEKHPGKAQELLKYLRDIRLAAYRAPSALAWVQYDEQVRLLLGVSLIMNYG